MFKLIDIISSKDAKPYEVMNAKTWQDYYDTLKLLAMTVFKWSGLPSSCSARFLEETLFRYGKACFVKDETKGFLTLRVTTSNLNYYNEPTNYVADGVGYTEPFTNDNCVLIRNNLIEKPTSEIVELLAYRLANAERIIDVNINGQKTPLAIACEENDKNSLERMFEGYDGNKPIFFTSKKLNLDAIKAIKTDVPFIADKLGEYKQMLWSDALTRLGINNNPNTKQERMIVDEANSNNMLIQLMAKTFLKTRQDACTEINKKFNLTGDNAISVSMDYDIEDLGGEIDGNI
jgi:hypothetical protein